MKLIYKYGLAFIFLLPFTIANAQYAPDSLKTITGYIHYYTKGKGKPVVLLQGVPFSSYYMRGVADSLNNYQCILIDYRGTGRSQYTKVDSTWANLDYVIKDVEKVRKHLSIKKWTLIGNSYGTHIALNYAIHYPQHTDRIILTACAGTDNSFRKYYSDNIESRLTEQDFQDLEKLPADDWSAKNQIAILKIYMQAYSFDRAVMPRLFDALPEYEARIFYNHAYQITFTRTSFYRNFDISKAVYALEQPIRIIQGRQDPITGDVQVTLNERAKNSKLIFIERAGHLPWLEQPKEFFIALRKCLSDE